MPGIPSGELLGIFVCFWRCVVSVDLGSAHGQIILDADGVTRGVSQAGASLRHLEGFAASTGARFASFAADLAVFAVKAGGAVAAGMGVAVVAGVKGASDLQQSVANISSIKPEIDVSQVTSALNDLSTRVPQSATQLADSLYNIFSSVDVTQQQALQLVQQFAQGAIGAQTDAETFGTAILGVMNAFGQSVDQAGHDADVFFNTINRGVVTGPELAAGLGPVTQSAKAAGLSIDQLGGFLAGVTKEGGPAAQNINNLNNFLQKITTSDAQKALNGLGVATVKADGSFREITDILGDLKPRLEGMTEAQRNNALQAIFPDAQARTGAQVLLSQLDFVKASIAENENAAGSAQRAFTTMVGTFKNQAALLRNTVSADLRTVGAAILPVATAITSQLTAALRSAQPAIQAFAVFLAAFLTTQLARVGAALPAIIDGLKIFVGVLQDVFGAIAGGDFGQVRDDITEIFDAGPVRTFALEVTRGAQLIRDAILTARQAAAGNWFGGQTAGISAFVRDIGRFTQRARDAFLTVRQVFDRTWVTSAEIQPVVRGIGDVATAVRNLGDRLGPALQGFGAIFTPTRLAILRQFADDLTAVRFEGLVDGIRLLGDVLPPVIAALGRLVAFAIDGLGALQRTGHESDVLRVALLALGGVLALNQFADFVAGANRAGGALASFFREITRGPRLVVTTIRTIYESIGQAINGALVAGRVFVQRVRTVYESVGTAVNTVGGAITRTVRTVFTSAQDAAIWAQLYGEQAAQTITRQVRTVYEALPSTPNIPDIIVRAIPQFDTSGIGSAGLPPISVQVQPQISPNIGLGSIGTDIGVKLAEGIATGIGIAIASALVASGAFAAIGAALVAAAPEILAGLAIVAAVVAIGFAANFIAQFVAASGGIGPALARIFLDGIPFALGAIAGVAANAGLQLINLIIQGLLQGVPALIGFVTANFQAIITTIGLIFAPLPTLILGIVQQIGPTLAGLADTIAATVGATFSQIGGIVSSTLGNLGSIAAEAFGAVVGAVGGAFSQIGSAVSAALAPIAGIIQSIIAGDWGGAVLAGIQVIIEVVGVLPGQIAAILGEGFGQVVGIIGDSLGAAAGAVEAAFGAIISTVATAGGAIVQSVGEAFSQVGSTIQSVLAGIGGAIQEALGSFLAGFSSTFNGELPGIVASGMAQVYGAVVSGIGAIVGLMGSLGGQMIGALGDIAGALFSAGAQMMNGLIGGIQSAAGGVLSVIAGLGATIRGAFQEAMKIQSPSRVMAELGGYVVQGLVVGMQAATPEAAKAAADAASAVYGAVKSGVEAINSLGTLRAPNRALIVTFAEITRDIVTRLSGIASSFAGPALEAVGKFASTANTIFGTVKSGVDAFAALQDVTQPTADQIGAFVAGMRDIVASLIAAARDFDAEGLAGAAGLADAATKILALVKPAVEAFGILPGIVQPTGEQLGVLTQGVADIALSIVRAARLFDGDGLAGASSLAEAGGKILALITPAVEGFALLPKVIQPTGDQLGVFTQGITDITLSLAQASRLFTAQGLAGASGLADAAGKALGLIAPAVAGFKALPGIMQPTADELGVFTAGIVDITLSLVNASRNFTAPGLAAATGLADAALKIVGLIKPAVDGFRALATVTAPSQAGVATFASGVASITRAIVAVAAQFTAEALTGAGTFSDTASKVLGLLGTGITALGALAKDDAVLGVDGGRLDQFAASLRQFVVTIGTLARTVSTELVQSAADFSDGAGKAVGLLSGADAFAKLRDFQPITAGEIDAFVNAVVLSMQRVAEGSKRIDAESAKAAGTFAESASKVTSLIGSAISAFTVKTNVDKDGNAKQADRLITTAEIDQIVFLAQYAVGRLVEVARGYDKTALAGLSAFGDAASKGFGALQNVLSAIQTPTKDNGPKEGQLTPLEAIDSLIGLFNEGLGRLGTLVGIVGQYRTAAQQVRSIMVEAGNAFGEALGALTPPTGVSAQALALATGGTFTVNNIITHRFEGLVTLNMPADDGAFVARSIRVDGQSRRDIADQIANELILAGPGGD